mmetsp:Transcript_126993/g.405980  ORF Transcript_126993/g.405980 Transcript_126993/m.405980 type:complete len:248 (-) Transcript_126993:128-871(-)
MGGTEAGGAEHVVGGTEAGGAEAGGGECASAEGDPIEGLWFQGGHRTKGHRTLGLVVLSCACQQQASAVGRLVVVVLLRSGRCAAGIGADAVASAVGRLVIVVYLRFGRGAAGAGADAFVIGGQFRQLRQRRRRRQRQQRRWAVEAAKGGRRWRRGGKRDFVERRLRCHGPGGGGLRQEDAEVGEDAGCHAEPGFRGDGPLPTAARPQSLGHRRRGLLLHLGACANADLRGCRLAAALGDVLPKCGL